LICPKCECELADKQKVCPRCGAHTPASFLYYTERKEFKLTKTHKIILACAGAFILLLIIIKMLAITPPDEVALKWANLMTQRLGNDAKKYESDNFDTNLLNRWPDRLSLTDEYISQLPNGNVTLQTSRPIYESSDDPQKATVTVRATDSGGSVLSLNIKLVKVGRRWLVEDSN
jgi:hypothetical protein